MLNNIEDNEDILGYLKYEGKKVEDGYMDARKAADILIGFDNALRYFLYQDDPKLKEFEFEIPIRLRKGSWEALIPNNIDLLILKGAIGWGVAKYVGSVLSEAAKNDFKDVNTRKIFKQAIRSITWVMKIAKHLGSMKHKKFENIKFQDNNRIVEITNNNEEQLLVPIEFVELYSNCPSDIFAKITDIIAEERELKIGLQDEKENEVKLEKEYKYIFAKKNNDEEQTILPNFKHEQYVELEGHVTRGNENTDTIGFYFDGHIITCYPENGGIVEYKNIMFSNCLIKGYIDRIVKDEAGNTKEKKPQIKFIDLIEIKNDNQTKAL